MKPILKNTANAHQRLRNMERQGEITFIRPDGEIRKGDKVIYMHIADAAMNDYYSVEGTVERVPVKANGNYTISVRGTKKYPSRYNLLQYLEYHEAIGTVADDVLLEQGGIWDYSGAPPPERFTSSGYPTEDHIAEYDLDIF